MVGLPRKKLSSFLWCIKDGLALQTPDVYSIPFKCRKVYIRQTGRLLETRVKEHHQHICQYHPSKSVVVEHTINLGHHIQLQNTSILAKKLRCMNRIMGEVTEIKLHPNNMNREEGFSLSWS
jgi:hypothetical protein